MSYFPPHAFFVRDIQCRYQPATEAEINAKP